jgi:hypothetical protein
MPLLNGVVKMLQICSPIKNANATTTGVYPPSALYAGAVNTRYKYASSAHAYAINVDPIDSTGPMRHSLTRASTPRSLIILHTEINMCCASANGDTYFHVSFAAAMYDLPYSAMYENA